MEKITLPKMKFYYIGTNHIFEMKSILFNDRLHSSKKRKGFTVRRHFQNLVQILQYFYTRTPIQDIFLQFAAQ